MPNVVFVDGVPRPIPSGRIWVEVFNREYDKWFEEHGWHNLSKTQPPLRTRLVRVIRNFNLEAHCRMIYHFQSIN